MSQAIALIEAIEDFDEASKHWVKKAKKLRKKLNKRTRRKTAAAAVGGYYAGSRLAKAGVRYAHNRDAEQRKRR